MEPVAVRKLTRAEGKHIRQRLVENWKRLGPSGWIKQPWYRHGGGETALPIMFLPSEYIFPFETITLKIRHYRVLVLLDMIMIGALPPIVGVLKSDQATIGTVLLIKSVKPDSNLFFDCRRVVAIAVDRFRIRATHYSREPYECAIVDRICEKRPLKLPVPISEAFPDLAGPPVWKMNRTSPYRRASAIAKKLSPKVRLARAKCPRSSSMYIDARVWDMFEEKKLLLQAQLIARRNLRHINLDWLRLDDAPTDDAAPLRWSFWLSSCIDAPQDEKHRLFVETHTAVRLRMIIRYLSNKAKMIEEITKRYRKKGRSCSSHRPKKLREKKPREKKPREKSPHGCSSSYTADQHSLRSFRPWPVSKSEGFSKFEWKADTGLYSTANATQHRLSISGE